MTPAFRWTLLWLVGSVALIAGALGSITASYVDGRYLPSNPDAFYHARRILDAVMHGIPVADFDARIHAPEGSWLTWPWGYDSLMARITRLFGPFANEAAATAWMTPFPLLFLPALFEEKMALAWKQFAHAQGVRARSRQILAAVR